MASILTDRRNKWFISKVKELEAAGISQADIAKKIGVLPQYLTPMLSGKRNASEKFVLKFCEVFNISPKDLYAEIGMPLGLMSEEEAAQQDADVKAGKAMAGESVPPEVLNNASYQNLLNKVQEQSAEITALNIELKDAYKEISTLQKRMIKTKKQ